MKRSILLMTVLSVFAISLGTAAEISVQQALQAAQNVCRIHGQLSIAQDKSLQHDFTRYENGLAVYHVFKPAGKPGFVIIAADDNVTPVLAWSFESDLNPDPEMQPPPVRNWLDFYTSQILYVKANDLKYDQNIQREWESLLSPEIPVPDAPLAAVAPLTTTLWAQGCFYNAECPATGGIHPAGPCGHVVVGCVATAMAMAMKYWDFPARGSGSHSYTDPVSTGDPSYGTVSATFNYAYDWDNMPNTVSAANIDVATLGYHAGVAVEMNYGYNSSGAWPVGSTEVADAFKDYFYYSNSTTDVLKASYTDAAWKTLMKGELNAGRVLVYGSDGTSGGHAYIVDGYDDDYLSSGNLYFHFNWGWSGTSNGYFQLSNLNPGGGHFTNNQEAIINLEPKSVNLSFDAALHTATINGTEISLGLQVESTGDAPAASSELGYYLSSNTIISQLDYRIGTDPVILLVPGAASNESITVDALDISPTIVPGMYYVGYLIDHNNDVEESSEGDNDYYVASSQVTVTCKAPAYCSASVGVYYDRINVGWGSVDYATHYRVYRNTINSPEFAIAVSDWQTGTTFEDFTSLPEVTYYYFVKAATSSSGTYAGPLSPSGSGYHFLQTITEDQTYNPSTTPRFYAFNPAVPNWCVAGIRPETGSDWDIYLYSATDYDDELAGSEYGTNQVDFVVMDGNHVPPVTRGLAVSRYSGSGDATLEWEGGSNTLNTGLNANISWPAGDVVEMWDVYLVPGFYKISLTYNSGSANLDVGIFQSPSSNYFSRTGLAGSSFYSGTTNESFYHYVSTADIFGILVWANDANPANFNLNIELAGTWQGDVSSNWHLPANWSAEVVPTDGIDVVIPAGCPNYPVISVDSAHCANLTMAAGTSITVNSADFRVYGNMECSGTLNLTATGSDVYVHGSIDWQSGSMANVSGSATMYVYGLWIFETGNLVDLTGGYVEFRGNSDGFIRTYGGTSSFNHIRNMKPTGYELGFSAMSTADVHVNGNIFNYSGKLLSSYSSFKVVIDGVLQNLGGNFTFITGAVEFSGFPAYSLKPQAGSYFNDLILNTNAGATLSLGNDYSDSLVIRNDLVIQSGTLNPGNMSLIVSGDWSNLIYPDGFSEGGSTVVFKDGPWHQYISSEDFNMLVVDKPSGGAVRMDGTYVTCAQYNWEGGGIDVLSGAFTASDLADNGIFGDYYVNPGGAIYIANNDGYVDINGNIYIYGGSINVYGGTYASYWPYFNDASLHIYTGGTLDFKDQAIYLFDTPMADMIYDINGGTIRTAGSFTGNHAHFHPAAGTVELYGSAPASVSLVPDAAFYHLTINKSGTDQNPSAVNPFLNRLRGDQTRAVLTDVSPLTSISATSDLDINGDFSLIAGTFVAPDSLFVAGNWINAVGEAAFTEGTGAVVFDSSASANLYSDERFYDLILDKTYGNFDGLILDYNRQIGVSGDLKILDGTFEMNSYSGLDVEGDITILEGAGLNAGGLDSDLQVFCSGNWDNQNTLPTNTILGFTGDYATVTFDGNNMQSLSCAAGTEVFNNLNIDKLLGAVLVNNNIQVSGDFTMTDGAWQNNTSGLIHQFYGDLSIGGFWNDLFFTDAVVEIRGLYDNQVSFTGSGSIPLLRIAKIAWAPGKAVPGQGQEPTHLEEPQATDLSYAVLLNSDLPCGTLTLDSGHVVLNGHTLAANSILMNAVEGVLELDTGSVVELGSGGLILNGGMIESIGTFAQKAQFRARYPGTHYPLQLLSGYLAATHTLFSGMNQYGVDIYSGLFVDPVYDLDSCIFMNGQAGGVLLGVDDQSMNIHGAVFPENLSGSNYNVRKYMAAGVLNFIGYSGLFSGAAYEMDPYNTIFWYTNLLVNPTATPPAVCPGGTALLSSMPVGGLPPYTFSWSPSADLSTPLAENTLATLNATSLYTVTATDALGNSATGSVSVEVWDPPVADAGADVSIVIGSNTPLNGSASWGTPPYTYTWNPPYALSDPGIANPIASPMDTTTYTLVVSDAHGCLSADDVTVFVTLPGGTVLRGHLNYEGLPPVPLSGVTVTLSQGSSLISTATTDATGLYEFTGLNAGVYTVECSSLTPWGGVNSADALIVLKHFVHMTTLTGLRLEAADVDGSGGINSIDAMLCAKRFTGMISSFITGDWAFESGSITASGSGLEILNLNGICYGDVNASYTPPYKTEPAILLVQEDLLRYPDADQVEIPFTLLNPVAAGAASLVLDYNPEALAIHGVSFRADNTHTLWNCAGNQVKISWYSLIPYSFAPGDILFTMQVQILNPDLQPEFTTSDGSELNDPMAQILPDIRLHYPKLIPETESALWLSEAIPNPAGNNTQFRYFNPEKGYLEYRVLTPEGKQVLYMNPGIQDAGLHLLTLEISDLTPGHYSCVFVVHTPQGIRKFTRTLLIVR